MTPLAAAEQLTSSIDAVAQALAAADIDGLLAAEEQLSSAVADLSRVQAVDPRDRIGVAQQLIRARARLAGCRVLGKSAADATHAALLALCGPPGYERSGSPTPDATDVVTRGSALKLRF